jgi:hypothetical protein
MKTNPLIILLTIVVAVFTSCLNNETKTISSIEEKSIIENMDCWDSYEASRIATLLLFEKDEKKKESISDDIVEAMKRAKNAGMQSLYNDTLFISAIRSDSLYKSKLEERKSLAKSLYSLKNSLPLFKGEMLLICKDVVKYNSYNSSFGISREGYNKEDFNMFGSKNFYGSTVDLFKEAYTKDINSKITDDQIVELKRLLAGIENIDKHIWAIPYFFQTKNKVESETLKKRQEQDKQNKFDTLSKK